MVTSTRFAATGVMLDDVAQRTLSMIKQLIVAAVFDLVIVLPKCYDVEMIPQDFQDRAFASEAKARV